MFDAFGTYNEGFILMGVMIALSGLMLYPIPCIKSLLAKVGNIFNTEISNQRRFEYTAKLSQS